MLKLGSGAEDKWLRRFQREGRAARRFRHPNVVAIHDLRVTPDGTAYMVLEFVEGRTLRQELHASGRMRVTKALSILTPLASALDAGHKSGVVHRDLKPDNVMIRWDESGEPVVKLLDLGIAKLLGVDEVGIQPVSTLTLAGQILGTPHYMSPEQWGEIPRDGSAEVDGRADVYSLAVMTFELLAGTWPIQGTDVPSIRAGHLSGSVPSVSEVALHLPAEVDAIIRRGMALDRMDRYDTAAGFVSALAAVDAVYRESMDQDLVPTRPSLVSSEEPTAILPRDSADGDQMLEKEGRDVLTAVWASGDPWPVAINSEPTDASLDDTGDSIAESAPPLPTLGKVDRPAADRLQWLKFSAWCIAILLLCTIAVWSLGQKLSR
ncbi:MAG: serine/threonine protein kinase [Blastocatellia bacterium]|nr:serine/threonine protein kinase [Blastocatellia bacterium]